MGQWRFKATTASGEIQEGEVSAGRREVVVEMLRARHLTPIHVVEADAAKPPPSMLLAPGRSRLGARMLAFFTVELATLLDAGVPLARALELLGRLAGQTATRELFARIHARVRGGASFAEAIAQDEAAFGRFYVNMVRAGERSGRLETTMRRLAEFLERAADLRESLASALWYPVILLVVAVLSMGLIVGVVVPRFAEMFADAGRELPWPTQVVLWAGEFLVSYGWACGLLLAAAALLARQLLRDPARRRVVDAYALRTPLVGRLLAEIEAARFTRALGTLLGGGVTMADALPVARNVVSNLHVAAMLDAVTAEVRAGRRLSVPLAEAGVFPRLATEMVKVGEEAGQMEAMLLKLADTYDREVATTLRRMVALAGPAVILLLGGLIALVIMSILVAVLGVNELVA